MQVLFPDTRNTSRREEQRTLQAGEVAWEGREERKSLWELQRTASRLHTGNLEHMVVVVVVRRDLGQEPE